MTKCPTVSRNRAGIRISLARPMREFGGNVNVNDARWGPTVSASNASGDLSSYSTNTELIRSFGLARTPCPDVNTLNT